MWFDEVSVLRKVGLSDQQHGVMLVEAEQGVMTTERVVKGKKEKRKEGARNRSLRVLVTASWRLGISTCLNNATSQEKDG